jgi:hypothetical protein
MSFTVLLPLIHVHSLAALGVGVGVGVGVLPPPLPPQPDANKAIETNNVKGIFPGNCISATFQT